MCKHARLSTEGAAMRNFLLCVMDRPAPAKTEGAQSHRAGLNLPSSGSTTCSANTEVYDFIGQVFLNGRPPPVIRTWI